MGAEKDPVTGLYVKTVELSDTQVHGYRSCDLFEQSDI